MLRSAGAAIGWEFGHRHRWALLALLVYLIVLTTSDLPLVERGVTVGRDGSPDLLPRFVATVLVPASLFTYYFVAVFSFGLVGDVAARESSYPARLFTLPVTTAALAGWPMLYGTATLAGLCLATMPYIDWPPGVDVPLIWPALFVAVSVAWAQALMWMAYGLPGLRVVVAVLWLATLDAIVFTAINSRVAESVMVAALAPQIPLAYVAARYAVARARRGDVPDWRGKLRGLARLAEIVPRRRVAFRSAARAQAWLEWQLHGRSLPVWVGILLPFELALLFVAGTPSLVAYTLAGVLLTPPFVAAFVAVSGRTVNGGANDSYGLARFTATRPLTSGALIAAKLRMAAWSTLAAWLLVLVAIPASLALSGTWPLVSERARQLSEAIGTPRTVAIGLLGVTGLVAWTWKQLVQTLYVGLSGRSWLIRTSTAATMTVLIFIEPIVEWIRRSDEVQLVLWNALPWGLAVLAFSKTVAAAWIATRLHRDRVLSDRALVAGAAGWLLAVLALYGVFAWFFSTPFVEHHLLVLVAILAVPLSRVSAAPLALASNRHR